MRKEINEGKTPMRIRSLIIGLLFTILVPGAGPAGCIGGKGDTYIIGAGSTFIFPILSRWALDYNKETGDQVNFQAIGSGGGLRQLAANMVLFAASDMPLKPTELDQKHYAQWPMIMGGIVLCVNLENIKPGAIVLDGETLASIFLGKITKWSDPALAKLNPGLPLPDARITVIHRSDGSGTTFNFTNYLCKVSSEWKNRVGSDTSVNWPCGNGGKGNAGVAANIAQIRNSIGYVEYAYALENNLIYTKMVNRAGKAVEPTMETFIAASRNADWSGTRGFYLILTDQPGELSWPILATTFILMSRRADHRNASCAALGFFDWAYRNGDQMARELDYVPIPATVWSKIEATWGTNLKAHDGQAIWPTCKKQRLAQKNPQDKQKD